MTFRHWQITESSVKYPQPSLRLPPSRSNRRSAWYFSMAILSVLGSTPTIVLAETKPVISKQKALSRALHITGLSCDSTNKSAIEAKVRIISLQDTTTPFLGEFARGRRVWQVDLNEARMAATGDSVADWTRDADIVAFVDSATGHVLKIVCDNEPLNPDLDLDIAANDAEMQLINARQEYIGFPAAPPAVCFAQAALACPHPPHQARQVIGQFVILKWADRPERPVWIITLRGLSPVRLFGGSPGDTPKYLLNRVRQIVDAATGRVISSGLIPSVRPRQEPNQ